MATALTNEKHILNHNGYFAFSVTGLNYVEPFKIFEEFHVPLFIINIV